MGATLNICPRFLALVLGTFFLSTSYAEVTREQWEQYRIWAQAYMPAQDVALAVAPNGSIAYATGFGEYQAKSKALYDCKWSPLNRARQACEIVDVNLRRGRSGSTPSFNTDGWCVWRDVNNWRKARLARSACQAANEYWYSSESAAQSKLNQLQNQVSVSSANQSGWCVWGNANNRKKSSFRKKSCQAANEYWYSSESAAQSKLNELQSADRANSANQSGWCVWFGFNNWRKGPLKQSQCQGTNQYWYYSEPLAQNKLNQLRLQDSSKALGWCVWGGANNWRKSPLKRSQCQSANEYWYSSESAAQSKLNQLQNQVSVSSANQPGWCVWGGANNWRKAPFARSACQAANEYWYSSESAAQSKLNELQSADRAKNSNQSGWCATAKGVSWVMAQSSCGSTNGFFLTMESAEQYFAQQYGSKKITKSGGHRELPEIDLLLIAIVSIFGGIYLIGRLGKKRSRFEPHKTPAQSPRLSPENSSPTPTRAGGTTSWSGELPKREKPQRLTNVAEKEIKVGIKEGWTLERKKAFVLSQFNRFNGLVVNTADTQSRDEMLETLKLLGELMAEYDA